MRTFEFTRMILADMCMRRLPYILMGLVLSFAASIKSSITGTFAASTTAIAVLMWMTDPQIRLMNSQRALRALPVSKRTLGRVHWWSTAGGSALSSIFAFGFTAILHNSLHNTFGESAPNLASVLTWMFLAVGFAGHSLVGAFSRRVYAVRYASTTRSKRSASAIRILSACHFATIVLLIAIGGTLPSTLYLIAILGYVIAVIACLYAEHLEGSLDPTSENLIKIVQSADSASSSNSTLSVQRLARAPERWLPMIILSFAAYFFFRGAGSTLSSQSLLSSVAVLVAFFVVMSGFFSAARWLISLSALRALPLSTDQITRKLLLHAIWPVVALGLVGCAVAQATEFLPTMTVVALTLHVAAMQSMWTPVSLSEASMSSRARITSLTFASVWALGTSFAIFAGAHWIAWITAPALAVTGYFWTRHIITTNRWRNGIDGRDPPSNPLVPLVRR